MGPPLWRVLRCLWLHEVAVVIFVGIARGRLLAFRRDRSLRLRGGSSGGGGGVRGLSIGDDDGGGGGSLLVGSLLRRSLRDLSSAVFFCGVALAHAERRIGHGMRARRPALRELHAAIDDEIIAHSKERKHFKS